MIGSGSFEHVVLVVPEMQRARGVVQVRRDAVRLERLRGAGDQLGKVEQRA